MFIYGIGNDVNNQKIGISVNPRKRLKQLQTGNPDKLSIHYSFEIENKYAKKYESYIHNQYSHKRKHGEWFDMTKEEVIELLTYHEIMLESSIHLL